MNRIRIDDLGPSVVAALRAGQTIVMPDVAASPELSAAEQLANAAAGIGAQVGVPLVKGGRLVAVFAVHQAAPRAWSDDEVGLIEETAQRTWAAVERARAEAALRESEARFRTVTNAVPQLIWTNDADGRATYFNQRWYAYSGLSEEQSVGPGWQAIVHPDDAPASVEHWRQVLAAGAPFETEYRLRRADGAFRWHLGRNVPLHDAGGQIIGWFGSATDIEELKQAEAAQRESAVLRQLAAAQEEERLRIARDLHDQLGQQITGLLLGLKRVEQAAAGTPIATMLSPLQELADELAREVHQLAVNLRPTALEDIGLVPALERLVTSWSAETAVPAAFERIGLGRGRLPRQVEVALFRVAQEALTNVRKHAEASRVGVIIERRGDQAVLVVEDDGRGFDVDKPAPDRGRPPLGLVGMRERVGQVGGTLEIEASPGRGTSVLVRIPLDTRPDSQ